MITSIQVRNIRGISSLDITDRIYPNKPYIFVAPNGFGKSSLATAFQCLKTNRLDLPSDLCYNQNEDNDPSLIIDISTPDDVIHHLVANRNGNQLSELLDVAVINLQLKPKAQQRNIGGRTISTASLRVEPLVVVSTIPSQVAFNYSYSNIKSAFGTNGKILPNMTSLFQDHSWCTQLSRCIPCLKKLVQTRNQADLQTIYGAINSHQGTTQEVRQSIEGNEKDQLLDIEPFKQLFDHLSSFTPGDEIDNVLKCIPVISVYNNNPQGFKPACTYSEFKVFKAGLKEMVSSFNTSWQAVQITEANNRLVVKFPNPSDVSNGQRDSMWFAAMLLKTFRSFRKKSSILIVDEIFDYLDEANLIAAQYYISKWISIRKASGHHIYPIILTHLNPNHFRTFVFSKQKVCYLTARSAPTSYPSEALIRNRNEATICDDVSKYLLHYHTGAISRKTEFAALGITESWGEGDNFLNYVNQQKDHYLNNRRYDPYAVCCSVRLEIERRVYNLIADSIDKEVFLATHKTPKKLDYATSKGVEVPEIYYLLGLVYNEALHFRENQDNQSPIINKLENVTIKSMIREVFA